MTLPVLEEPPQEKMPFVSMGEARRTLAHYKETIASLKEEIERLRGLIESKDKIIERFSIAYPMRNKSDYNG